MDRLPVSSRARRTRLPARASGGWVLPLAGPLLLAALLAGEATSKAEDRESSEATASANGSTTRDLQQRAAPQPELWAQHGEVGDFFNPWKPDPKSIWGMLRWQLFSRNAFDKSQTPVVPVVPNDGAYLKASGSPPSVTWVGHATLAIHDGDAT